MARFTPIVFYGILTEQRAYLLDSKTGVLTLFDGEVIINQIVLTLRQAQFLFLLSEHSPQPFLFTEMLAWYYDKEVASATQRYNSVKDERYKRERLLDQLIHYASVLRLLLHPLGLSVVARPRIGYEVHYSPYDVRDEREQFSVLALGNLLPPGEQVLLDPRSRVLTLSTGKTIIEQCIVPRNNLDFFLQIVQNYPQPTTYEELFAWYYQESFEEARKRYAYVRGDKYQFQLMALGIKKHVRTLRPRLQAFGITLDNLKMFGYTLGSTPRFLFGRAHRSHESTKKRKETRHAVLNEI